MVAELEPIRREDWFPPDSDDLKRQQVTNRVSYPIFCLLQVLFRITPLKSAWRRVSYDLCRVNVQPFVR